MRKGFCYIVILCFGLLLWSCGTTKNTKASRFYHSLTSRYNIYFNGKTSFDEAYLSMQNGYKESYSEMIYMFPISAQPKNKQTTGGPFDRAIEKSNKAIKLHSIKAKPPKKAGWRNDPKQRSWQERQEYNPFLKKCWLLLGEAQFYNADFLQASATFSYIARHYAQDEEILTEAKLWQARCYTEMGWLYESEDILGKLNNNGMPQKNLNQYATVYADYLVREKRFEDAIPYFKTAIKAEKNKRQRTRMKYLLGQMYADMELNGLAYKMFGEVIRANPPYELEFAARIRQTEVFSGQNSQKMVNVLRRMGKSPKNKDFQDQIYYALGNLYMTRQDTVNAIKNYETGISKSTRNGMEKALCQIKLGDLYFTMRDYIKAQPCFSGALAGIKKEYKDYDRVSWLSSVLDELVVHAQAVHLQDSLQAVAKMPEAERLALIDRIIEKVKKEEEEAKAQAEKDAYIAEQEAKGTGIERPGTELNAGAMPISSTGLFYFYNPQIVAQGKTQFQRRWGRRVLEDNWRRRKKALATFNENVSNEESLAEDASTDTEALALAGDSLDESSSEILSDDPKTREYYIQQLPLAPEDIDASNIIIVDGLFNMAMIYKDKLEDLPLSIEAFEELERRFPHNTHSLESYYQIYLMALRDEDRTFANEYKARLIREFPESDYAVAIANPDYEYNIRTMDRVQDSTYQASYRLYLSGDTTAVRRNFRMMNEKYPLADLMPKFMFLDALTYVQAGDADGFKNGLKALLDKYPTADVSELAGEMLKGVLKGRMMVQGNITGMTWNLRFGTDDDGSLSRADSARAFNAETQTPYRMFLVYPTGSFDRNQLLYVVAAYNFANLMVKEFDLSIEQVGSLSMLHIKGFYNFAEVAQYYKMIYGKDGYAKVLGENMAILPISEDNYETLMHGKTLEEYVRFFEENFGGAIPDLMTRWKARSKSTEEKIEPVAKPTTEPEKKDAGMIEPIKKDEVAKRIIELETPIEPQSETAPIPVVPPANKKDLTLKDIEEIRKKELALEEERKDSLRREFEVRQLKDKEGQTQVVKDRQALQEKQKTEDEALLKAKAEQEKKLELDRKTKLKQAQEDRKAKEKAVKELQKQKEKEYKAKLKRKEEERKEKERLYKAKQKDKAKQRAKALKEKEAAFKRKR